MNRTNTTNTTNTTKTARKIPFTGDQIVPIVPELECDPDEMFDDVDVDVPSDEHFAAMDDELLDEDGEITDAGWEQLSAWDANGEFV